MMLNTVTAIHFLNIDIVSNITAPGSKRHYSTNSGEASTSLEANQTKRPKFDLNAEQFTGKLYFLQSNFSF